MTIANRFASIIGRARRRAAVCECNGAAAWTVGLSRAVVGTIVADIFSDFKNPTC